jgi:phospholipase/lecithinase/hemolysin
MMAALPRGEFIMGFRLRALGRSLAIGACVLTASAVWAGQFNYPAMVVFGDSLSDTGNDFVATTAQQFTPAIPPSVTPYATYWQGRFSNGPVAVEYLWRLVARRHSAEVAPSLTDPALQSKAAISFAFGGSTTGISSATPTGLVVPGLLGQVEQFAGALQGRKASKQALYVVWSGSNDYLLETTNGPYAVVGNITHAIRTLYALGARDFLVPNLANLGTTPLAQAQGVGPQLTQLTLAHNALLKSSMAALGRELHQARFVNLDVYKLGEVMASTGLVITDTPAVEYLAPDQGAADCLIRDPATCIDISAPSWMPPFLYWDVMHPTTQVHGILGTAMFGALLTQR